MKLETLLKKYKDLGVSNQKIAAVMDMDPQNLHALKKKNPNVLKLENGKYAVENSFTRIVPDIDTVKALI